MKLHYVINLSITSYCVGSFIAALKPIYLTNYNWSECGIIKM